METLIKKLVLKVNTNELSQEELNGLKDKVEHIEGYLKRTLFDDLGDLKASIEWSRIDQLNQKRHEGILQL